MDETGTRHIIHADLDAFYAAVEQLDNPDLRGKPVIVGGRPEDRGVVATASYEARKFGVHSAMPMSRAVRLCPEGIRVSPRFQRYKEISDQVMGMFLDVTHLVEPMSMDEAYLDITGAVEEKPPLAIAIDLKTRVHDETGLTLSIGVAAGKSVAKIASDLQKPDGLVVVHPGEEASFLSPLGVEKLPGIGPKTAERLRQEGVETIGQLADMPADWHRRRFGKRGDWVMHRSRGVDHDRVNTERETKSVSAETTFSSDISDPVELREVLTRLTERVAKHLERKGLLGRTVSVKLRLADFTTFTRQGTLPVPTHEESELLEQGWRLLSNELTPGRSFRLLGVGVSGFGSIQQLPLPLAMTEASSN